MDDNTIIVCTIGGIGILSLIVIAAVFEILNRRGVKKRKPDEATTKRTAAAWGHIQVRSCLDCPCFKDWCTPTCNLDLTIVYSKDYSYTNHTVHPACPLRKKHHILSYKRSSTVAETIVTNRREEQ